MAKQFLDFLKSEKGNQSFKSLIGVSFFIVFVVVSILINNPEVPLSYRVAFGSSHGGSGGGGGGGGGGSVSSSGTYSSPVNNSVSFYVDSALGAENGVKPSDNTVMKINIPAGRVAKTTSVKLESVSFGSSSVNGAVGSLPSGYSVVNDNLLNVNLTDTNGNKVTLSGPAFLEFQYASNEVANKDVSSLLGYRWNSDNKNWDALPTTVVVDGGVVRINVTTSKTSYFAVLGKPGKGVPVAASSLPASSAVVDKTSLIASIRQQLAGLISQVLALLQDSIKSGKTVSPELQKQLASLSTTTTSSTDLPPSGLYKGDKGDNVKKLQELLVKWNVGPAAKLLATTGVTGFYGDMTVGAVYELQSSLVKGNSPAAKALADAINKGASRGGWGPLTRNAQVEYLK